MTESQRKAIWNAAFSDLGEAINRGNAHMPTKVELTTQWATPDQLLSYADNSYSEPLPISIFSTFAAITVPVGELLDLPITWTIMAQLNDGDRETNIEAFQVHNRVCLRPINDLDTDDAAEQQHGQMDDVKNDEPAEPADVVADETLVAAGGITDIRYTKDEINFATGE